MDKKQLAIEKHKEWKGKIEVISRAKVTTPEELSIAYTPGVAEPCLLIAEDESLAYDYTRKGNLVAVITDGTAVLGLGDIGPSAAMPVMRANVQRVCRGGRAPAVCGFQRCRYHRQHHCPDLQELWRHQPGGHCGSEMFRDREKAERAL